MGFCGFGAPRGHSESKLSMTSTCRAWGVTRNVAEPLAEQLREDHRIVLSSLLWGLNDELGY